MWGVISQHPPISFAPISMNSFEISWNLKAVKSSFLPSAKFGFEESGFHPFGISLNAFILNPNGKPDSMKYF